MSPAVTISSTLASSGLVPFEARLLLANVLGRDRAWLAAHADESIAASAAQAFATLARRRRDGEPIAYLTGHREFYGLDLEVTPEVLIPRPETELLVELALERVDSAAARRALDLGTGSGAIALALARQRPQWQVLGADRSAEAVALARRNASRLGLANARFIVSDWFAGVPPEPVAAIAANPPYVADGDPHLTEGDLRFEPQRALLGGPDGLDAIRRIAAGAPAFLAAGGWLLVEHGYDQAERVRSLLTAAGFVAVESRRDLAGIARVTLGRTGRG